MKTKGTAAVRCDLRVAPCPRFTPSPSARRLTTCAPSRRASSPPLTRLPSPALQTLPIRDFALAAAPEVTSTASDGTILLFGATGRVGSLALQQLLQSGRDVVAAVRSSENLGEISAGEMGKRLRVVDGVNVLNPEALTASLFEGVDQVMICIGPRTEREIDFFEAPDDDVFAVDSRGVANITAAAERFLTPLKTVDMESIQLTPEMQWESFGDRKLGGSSSSQTTPRSDGNGVRIEGNLVAMTEGCEVGYAFESQWSSEVQFDCRDADGVRFSVKGDGRSYFLQLQTSDTETSASYYFVAPFDTVEDGWTDVSLRFHEFRFAQNGYAGTETILKPSVITKIGFMCANTGPDTLPARNSPVGHFALEVDTLYGFRATRPQIVHLSSAAVERSARVGEDLEKRHEQIPIVRLNPGGTINHKYEGENIIRRSSLPYAIIRATQLITQEFEDRGLTPDLLQVGQGDTMMGRIRCVEVAEVLVQCLDRPETAFATFELRRDPGPEAKKQSMSDMDYMRMFSVLKDDRERAKIGLPPFAEPIPAESPIELGGRKWVPPKEELIDSVVEQRDRLHAKRDTELLPQA